MKRTAALAIALILILLCSCSAAEQAESFERGLEVFENSDKDFGGITIRIMSSEDGVLRYQEDTIFADNVTKRLNDTAVKFNCNIPITPNTGDNTVSMVSSAIIAGVTDYNILYADCSHFRNCGNAGYLLEIDAWNGAVDWTDSFRWGSKNVLEQLCCNGKMMGVPPCSWIDHLVPYYFFVIANDDLFTRNGFSVPSEYLETQTWNRDMFEQVTAQCYDETRSIYGLETTERFIIWMAMFANGMEYITEDGENGLLAENTVNGIDWGVNFIKRNKDCINTSTAEDSTFFLNGQAAMCFTDMGRLCSKIAFGDQVREFTVLPFPNGPDVDEGFIGGFFSTNLMTAAIFQNDPYSDESAILINEIFSPMENIGTLDALKSYYRQNIFYKDSDVDLIFRIQQADTVHYYYNIEDASSVLATIADNALNSGASSAIEKYADTLEKYMDYIKENKAGLETYFGGN